MQTMKIDYDQRFDTLYVAIGDKTNSYGDDSSSGIILMRDMRTEAITGFTILSFLKKYRNRSMSHLKETYCQTSCNRQIPRHPRADAPGGGGKFYRSISFSIRSTI